MHTTQRNLSSKILHTNSDVDAGGKSASELCQKYNASGRDPPEMAWRTQTDWDAPETSPHFDN
jgi:hypothetical protein